MDTLDPFPLPQLTYIKQLAIAGLLVGGEPDQ